jgi:hypothetical protein
LITLCIFSQTHDMAASTAVEAGGVVLKAGEEISQAGARAGFVLA